MAIGGWAGKIMRVNLTTKTVTTEETSKYQEFIGGMGIGYKVMYDEVPAGTKAFDPANKIVFGSGPFCGTGVPCSSRTNITSLLPTNPLNLVTDSHMGGNFAVAMKYAGWDAIIVEGVSDKPVWLRVKDATVSIEDASHVWGTGIYNSSAQIASQMGEEATVACIGQAGENMVPMSVIMTGASHSAGGHGGVMGSKKLKAIAIIGTGSVKIAGNKSDLIQLDKYMLSDIIGANNQHVVPSTPQPWAEFSNERTRWTSREGLHWGASEGNIETGINEPKNINEVGYRTMKAVFDMGPLAEKYTVRMGGCASCPIRCHSQLEVPKMDDFGVSRFVANTCMGYHSPSGIMFKGKADQVEKGDGTLMAMSLGSQLADDYGVWCNYGQAGRDLAYAYDSGILKKVLPAAEYKSIPWDKLEAGDPTFLQEYYRRIALKIGEFSHFGDGSYNVAKRWKFGDDYWNGYKAGLWSPLGYPKHHSNECAAQVGALISCMFNRDAQSHSVVNLTGSGLPIDVQKNVIAQVKAIGSGDALDNPAKYTPMNEYKAKFAKWGIIRNCLHDSLTLCNWMWPMTTSPLKERNYVGDTALESHYFSTITGIETSEEQLDLMGERIFTLHRALTVKQMGTMDMRGKHDVMADWVYDNDPDKAPFTEGTIKMDRDDMQLALTMFYKEMGWDEKTGAPTRATLERLNLKNVADDLASLNLLPA